MAAPIDPATPADTSCLRVVLEELPDDLRRVEPEVEDLDADRGELLGRDAAGGEAGRELVGLREEPDRRIG